MFRYIPIYLYFCALNQPLVFIQSLTYGQSSVFSQFSSFTQIRQNLEFSFIIWKASSPH